MKLLLVIALMLPLGTALAQEGGRDAFGERTPGITTTVGPSTVASTPPRRLLRRRASDAAARRRAAAQPRSSPR